MEEKIKNVARLLFIILCVGLYFVRVLPNKKDQNEFIVSKTSKNFIRIINLGENWFDERTYEIRKVGLL